MGRTVIAVCFAAACLVQSMAPPGALAQNVVVPKASAEAAAMERLAARLSTRRSILDTRREALAKERDRLSAIDQPAGEAERALWRDRTDSRDRLESDLDAMWTLIGALTPEALLAVPIPEASPVLVPDLGLSRAGIAVNLRAAPGETPFAELDSNTLVVRLAADTFGEWSLVMTPIGIGFVPASQLQREP